MSNVVSNIEFLVLANAIVAFGLFFYWQAIVILNLLHVSDLRDAHIPWKAWGNPNGLLHNFHLFISGLIFPSLRRTWLCAVGYFIASFVILMSIG